MCLSGALFGSEVEVGCGSGRSARIDSAGEKYLEREILRRASLQADNPRRPSYQNFISTTNAFLQNFHIQSHRDVVTSSSKKEPVIGIEKG